MPQWHSKGVMASSWEPCTDRFAALLGQARCALWSSDDANIPSWCSSPWLCLEGSAVCGVPKLDFLPPPKKSLQGWVSYWASVRRKTR